MKNIRYIRLQPKSYKLEHARALSAFTHTSSKLLKYISKISTIFKMRSTIVMVVMVAMVVTGVNGCKNNMDCSLNGVCNAGACVCDKPWAGNSCKWCTHRGGVGERDVTDIPGWACA